MDRDNKIRALVSDTILGWFPFDDMDDIKIALKELAENSYDAGLAAATKWHKASEKPPKAAYYLVDLGDGFFATKWYDMGGYEWDKTTTRIRAWRELPPPYEEAPHG